MPSDSSLKAFLSSLSPEDVATLFAGLRNTLPIGMGVYSPELNAGEAEVIAKRQAERDAARAREMEILSRLLPQAMAKRQAAIPESGADPFVPTRPRIMRESPFMFTQPQMSRVPQQYATGGGVLADQTTPDMSDGGQMIADPQPFAGGGKVEALKLLKGDLWHGGSYKKGETITQPLYTTPSREMAESYVEPDRVPGSVLQKLRAEVKRPAPERLVKAASRKFVPENEASGYTPASAFDANLHDPASIAAMIRELRRRGYDSAAASDISMGTGVEAPALVLFPGSKAYAGGGGVFGKKSLDQMQAELLSKEGLSRRALFGLRPDYPLATKQEPLSKVEQEVQRAEQAARKKGEAPSVTASRVDVDPGTGRKKSIMESVTETPVSRRTVLKTAGSQVAQSMLPMGDLMRLAGAPAVTSPVGAIAQAARVAPALPVTMESVIAGAMSQGLRKREVINEALRKFPDQDFEDVEDVYRTLKDPYRYINFDASDIDLVEAARPAETMRGFIGAPSESPLFSMRPYMRALRQASPEVYGRARTYSKDTAESAIEDLIDRGVLRSEDEIKRFLRNDPEIFEIMGSR